MFKPNEIYQKTELRKIVYKLILENSERMLRKAKIVTNLKTATLLAKIVKKYDGSDGTHVIDSQDRLHLFMILMECYENVTDEVAIVSAFENYAKSKLLRGQYIIHEFEPGEKKSNQRDIWERQKKSPCHIRSYSTLKGLKLKETTLSASILLNPNYSKKYGLSNACIKQLKQFNVTRNSVHMNTRQTSTFGLEQIEAIHELKLAIERHI